VGAWVQQSARGVSPHPHGGSPLQRWTLAGPRLQV